MRLDIPLPTSVDFAHSLLTDRLQPGDCVVDATAAMDMTPAFSLSW